MANLATDSATSTVCASHLPRHTAKWLGYGCHTSVLLFDWCILFLVLFQLFDVPQTLKHCTSNKNKGISKEFDEWIAIAKDRSKWRELVHSISKPPDASDG